MAEVLNYGHVLSGMTSGRGTYTMHTTGYQEVPGHLVEQVLGRERQQHAAA